jgi:hypothetical protein
MGYKKGRRRLINTWNTFLASSRRRIAMMIARLTQSIPGEEKNTSWAQWLKTSADVPEAFQSFFESLRAAGRPFPYAVLTPTFEGYLETTTEKLICIPDREVNVLERKGNTHTVQSFPLEGISYVEMGTILLDSNFKISGETKSGSYESSTLKFNTATDELFAPFLKAIRLGSLGARGNSRTLEPDNFNAWMGLSFKFMNYARRSLLEGEKVIQAVLQPEIRAKVMTVLGWTFYRRISPPLACILSDREFILIRETDKHLATEKYGGIWDYIPLKKIGRMALTSKNADVLILTIHLPHHDHLECLFQSSASQEVSQLINRFKELTAA